MAIFQGKYFLCPKYMIYLKAMGTQGIQSRVLVLCTLHLKSAHRLHGLNHYPSTTQGAFETVFINTKSETSML